MKQLSQKKEREIISKIQKKYGIKLFAAIVINTVSVFLFVASVFQSIAEMMIENALISQHIPYNTTKAGAMQILFLGMAIISAAICISCMKVQNEPLTVIEGIRNGNYQLDENYIGTIDKKNKTLNTFDNEKLKWITDDEFTVSNVAEPIFILTLNEDKEKKYAVKKILWNTNRNIKVYFERS